MKTYLGDGVYAEFDGYMVKLSTERMDGWHNIFFEPSERRNLQVFLARVDEAIAEAQKMEG